MEGVGSPYRVKGVRREHTLQWTLDIWIMLSQQWGYRATFFTFVSKNKAILIENYVVCAL